LTQGNQILLMLFILRGLGGISLIQAVLTPLLVIGTNKMYGV